MVVMGANDTAAALPLLLVQAAATDTVNAGCCSSASQLHKNLTDIRDRNESPLSSSSAVVLGGCYVSV